MEEVEECVPGRPFERSERRRDGAGAVEAAVVIGAASEAEPVTGAAAAAETMVVALTGAARALASVVEAVVMAAVVEWSAPRPSGAGGVGTVAASEAELVTAGAAEAMVVAAGVATGAARALASAVEVVVVGAVVSELSAVLLPDVSGLSSALLGVCKTTVASASCAANGGASDENL